MQTSADATMATPDQLSRPVGTAPDKPTLSLSDVRELFLHDLTHAERLLTVLWYAERMTPAEIGAVLDLPESDVVAMHARVLTRMRAA
jgi:DNA-directed RNA polymerase specialized sigma24 family protein